MWKKSDHLAALGSPVAHSFKASDLQRVRCLCSTNNVQWSMINVQWAVNPRRFHRRCRRSHRRCCRRHRPADRLRLYRLCG